jgi:hypothetical protein
MKAATVLVWSTGHADSQTAAIASWIQASGRFTSVTGVNTSTMTLAQLLAYDEVLYFSNTSNAGQDPNAIGDTLDDFAATGRRLVVAPFAFADQGGNTLGGRLITNGTSPFLVNGVSLYSPATMGSNDGSGFFTGVASVEGFYRDNVQLSSGATARGLWSDGVLLLATKGNVVGVNLFPDDFYGNVTGDYRQLFVDSLAAGAGAPVPEPSTLLLSGTALLGVALARLRRK